MSKRQNPKDHSRGRRGPGIPASSATTQGTFIHTGPADFGGGAAGGPPPDDRSLSIVFVEPLTAKSFEPHNTTLHEVLSSTHTEGGRQLMEAANIGLAAISGHLDNNSEICKISIFSDIRNQVSDAQSLASHIAAFKDKNKDYTVKSASFSHVTKTDLDNLGIKDIRTFKLSEFVTRINLLEDKESHDKSLDTFWDKYGADLEKVLEDIEAVASMRPEASARLMIDQFMMRCVRYLKENGQYPLLFPELRIASTKSPVRLSNGSTRNAIFVTGTVDYALFVSSTGSHRLLRRVKKALQNINDLQQLMDFKIKSVTLSQFLQQRQMNLFLVEAKTGNEDKSLNKFIPQAVTESLAALQVTETKEIAWCLTTGTASIFGVIWWNSDDANAANRIPIVAHSDILLLKTGPEPVLPDIIPGVEPEDEGAISEDEGLLSDDEEAISEDEGPLPDDEGAIPEDKGAMPEDKGAMPEDKGAMPEVWSAKSMLSAIILWCTADRKELVSLFSQEESILHTV